MNEIRPFDIKGFKCKRCGHEWLSIKPIKPVECPSCRSSLWNVQDAHNGYSIDIKLFPTAKYNIMGSSKRFLNSMSLHDIVKKSIA